MLDGSGEARGGYEAEEEEDILAEHDDLRFGRIQAIGVVET